MTVHSGPYSRPADGTATGRVWQIADAITRREGRKARRREVVEAYVAQGGNPNTASTQYYYWSQATGEQGAPPPPAPRGGFQLRVDPSGRITLPPELVAGLDLRDDGRITARLVDGELRLITPQAALRRLRATARAAAPDGMAVVDEFIAEKRREAELE